MIIYLDCLVFCRVNMSASSSSFTAVQPDDLSKAKVVHMILNRRTEEALQNLSKFYNTTPPEIVVGTIKGKRRSVYAVYVQKEGKIYAINSDIFYNPFVVLHEFYHHIRTKGGIHRGSENMLICSLQTLSMHIRR